ncbi:MAG: hypothetical protein ACPGOV_14600 [Magnetovibrionaceae bacterium]
MFRYRSRVNITASTGLVFLWLQVLLPAVLVTPDRDVSVLDLPFAGAICLTPNSPLARANGALPGSNHLPEPPACAFCLSFCAAMDVSPQTPLVLAERSDPISRTLAWTRSLDLDGMGYSAGSIRGPPWS